MGAPLCAAAVLTVVIVAVSVAVVLSAMAFACATVAVPLTVATTPPSSEIPAEPNAVAIADAVPVIEATSAAFIVTDVAASTVFKAAAVTPVSDTVKV